MAFEVGKKEAARLSVLADQALKVPF